MFRADLRQKNFMPTRRQFITNCTALALTASLTPTVALTAPFRSREIALEQISFLDFATKINSRFQISAESRAIAELRLVGTKLLSAREFVVADSGDARNEKFSLLFAGEANAPLQSDTYQFGHEGIGQFEMFITPVGPGARDCCYYEAVFNRPVAGNYRADLEDFRKLRR
jgi:hypothetical protein